MTQLATETLHERFAAVADRFADAVAVSDHGRHLRYAEVFDRARSLAADLRALDVPPGSLVALRVPRSAEFVVGVLGIMLAGCGYVPVDPAYPAERQEYVLDDSGVAAVVTPDGEAFAVRATGAVAPTELPDDIAYVIYTSGSTGAPKGVLVGHRQVLALIDACDERYEFDAADVWTLFHSPSFDFSVWELWGALLHGGRLVVVPAETGASPPAFARLLAEESVTVLSQVPTSFGYLVAALEDEPLALPCLRYVVFGGEAVNPAAVERWFAAGWAPGATVVNMYGITETTVHVTHAVLTPGRTRPRRDATPIGTPLAHLRVIVVDDDLRPVPPGTAGEMLIAGAGVSHGYLNRPELTGRRFVRMSDVDGLVYRSGDWGVLDEDGRLHYVGRRDGQVQLRGFRIECGEIEATLSVHPGVLECAVVLGANRLAEPVLEAHVVPRGAPVAAAELRAHLRASLPAHMVPGRFRVHTELPRAASGKIDRAVLAAAGRPAAQGRGLERA
ncbi:nonribosomal peptide synthetase DhbF [Lentzea xinjiangensis]|uniref:Nonribosomal peptide synthetase DhbF n=1 Tax=Lentzea xinjiangensis TaxID=402600 RepID=A0A1H9WM67_9PSEU|nr:amino acid adenylation domain-containing protein [Lentzea xinjiangensis]SES34990.1 nonribosomal peptide synthetase DhbF [Lentzea xinjiangensis]